MPGLDRALTMGAATLAGTIATKALNTGWSKATGKEPPLNPDSDETTVLEAILWAALSGALIAVVRMLATRQSTRVAARFSSSSPGDEATEQAREAR